MDYDDEVLYAACFLHDIDMTSLDSQPSAEKAEAILREIESGMIQVQGRRFNPEAVAHGIDGPGYTVEPNRKRAIALGIAAARAGDTVLIAGKGHETYQIIGGKTLPFDDRVEARKVLVRLSGQNKE